MDERIKRSGCRSGGIISLVRLIEEHGRALEYDLMTRTGRTLEEYMQMGAAGKVALLAFLNNVTPDSAVYRVINPDDEFGEWHTQAKTNLILADFVDMFIASRTKEGCTPVKYPRPRKKQKIGKGAIPISEFWDWWNKEE